MSPPGGVRLADAPAPAIAVSGETTARRAAYVLWPLAVYTVLSLILFGLPVLGHLGSRIVASDALDSSQFMWFFGWWPHALLHGLNPFVTHEMFVPDGFNLTWSTAMPGTSLLLAPVTLAFSPAVTWNVIQLASPALSAWTMFVLARHLTGRGWPSLLAGYVFGFSPYMLIHLTGGPYLALVPLLPVFVLLVIRRLDGTLGERRFVALMTAALTGQYLISSEVLATATLFGAIALGLAYGLMAARRGALRRVVALLGIAYVATAVLISPFLFFFFFGHQYPPGHTSYSADLAWFVSPGKLLLLSRHGTESALSGNTESYLGLPLVVMIGLFIWRERRSRAAMLLLACMVIAAGFSLGKHLHIHGHTTSLPGPWLPFAHLPVLRYAIPVRFAVFVALPAAIVVALWLARPAAGVGGRRIAAPAQWLLAAAVVVAILPDVGSTAWNTRIVDPPFFSTEEYRAYLSSRDHVLTVPVWGPNERWQADTGFRFQLAAGYAGNPFPPSYARFPTWQTLLTGVLTRDYAAQLRRFIHAKGVTAVVIDEAVGGPWRQLFGTLGVRPVSTGGVLLYRLR